MMDILLIVPVVAVAFIYAVWVIRKSFTQTEPHCATCDVQSCPLCGSTSHTSPPSDCCKIVNPVHTESPL